MNDIINKYLDEKNTELYNKLSGNYKISLIKINEQRPDGRNDLWQCLPVGKDFNISYYKDVKTTASFTHELLHIDIIDKGFANFEKLFPHIKEGERNLIFQPIIGHINNIFAHPKFYDDFINLGYAENEFLTDYHQEINLEKIMAKINEDFANLGLPNEGIWEYITAFYTAKDNRNPSKNETCENLLQFLQRIDNRLFYLLNNNWNSWINSASVESESFLIHLFDQTENWYKNRNNHNIN